MNYKKYFKITNNTIHQNNSWKKKKVLSLNELHKIYPHLIFNNEHIIPWFLKKILQVSADEWGKNFTIPNLIVFMY